MRKTSFNLTLLTSLFVTSLIISNVVTGKLVATGIHYKGTEVILPGAMFCYAITFLVTDVIGEIWGKQKANDCVKLGFICQLLAMALIQLTRLLPSYEISMKHAYDMVLGQGYIYVIGSLIAYWTAQSWDVFIFHKIRNICIAKFGNTNCKWIWNNVSTITSQFLDTMVFITISFGIGLGWLFHKQTLPMLGLMIIGQYIFKAILAILDTPFFYVLTRKDK